MYPLWSERLYSGSPSVLATLMALSEKASMNPLCLIRMMVPGFSLVRWSFCPMSVTRFSSRDFLVKV